MQHGGQSLIITQTMNCPTCKTKFDAEKSLAMPFCSERCRTIDLGRWLDEHHSLPSLPDPEADELPPDFANQLARDESAPQNN